MREWLDYIDRQGKNNIVIARNKIITIYEIIKINQKILDERYKLGQVMDSVYQKQCLEFQKRREKYEKKLKKHGKLHD